MSTNSIFGAALGLIERSLDFMALRHKVIAANIANVDTPNYKAFDLVLMEAIGLGPRLSPLSLTSSGNHLPSLEPEMPRALLVYEKPLNYRQDGNTVDIDKEMTKLAYNNLSYNAAVQALAKLLANLKYAIEEGGK